MQMDGDDMMVADGFKIGIQYPFVVGNWQTNLVCQKYHLDSEKCNNVNILYKRLKEQMSWVELINYISFMIVLYV